MMGKITGKPVGPKRHHRLGIYKDGIQGKMGVSDLNPFMAVELLFRVGGRTNPSRSAYNRMPEFLRQAFPVIMQMESD
jgi:hypothetical protein